MGANSANKLLIVDDDDEIRTQMRWALADEYKIVQAADRPSAITAFETHHPPVVLLDLGLPPDSATPNEGFATLAQILEINPRAKVVIVSGQSEKAIALRAIGEGAYDFVGKPVDVDELKVLLRRIFRVAELETAYAALQNRLVSDGFEGMIGTSPRMKAVINAVEKVADTNAPVLILGETGTGKELTARAIHQRSSRRNGPFVPINCSAIPETLIESELFGHEKGSFTGAHNQRIGHIESADGGTLFLDEVGEIPAQVQVKLLRFLQEKTIQRVGGRQGLKLDVRVVAATNADLAQGMRSGNFREDLFYRLAVVKIELPALRDRGEDLMLLASSFLHSFAAEFGRGKAAFSNKAVRAMQRYPWPGNVRELQNRVRRAVIMGDSPRLAPADLELPDDSSDEPIETLKDARVRMEQEFVTKALLRNAGKIAAAAKELGVSRPTLYELIDKLGIDRDTLAPPSSDPSAAE